MDFQKWFEDWYGITKLKQQIQDYKNLAYTLATEKNDWNAKWFQAYQQYQVTLNQLSQVSLDLQTAKELDQKDKDIILSMQKQNDALLTQLKSITANALFKKGKPALLKQVPASQVMLGDFAMHTSFGSFDLHYPDHPSIFFPTPYYEHVLDQANVNFAKPTKNGTVMSPVDICVAISNVCQEHMKYAKDPDQWYGWADNWTLAPLTDLLGREDCESESTNILSAIMYWQTKYGAFDDYSCFLGLGYYKNGGYFGHGFVVLLHDTSTNLKDSWIIEGTVEFSIPALNLDEHKNIYGIEWGLIGFVREDFKDGTYQIDDKYIWWGSNKQVGAKMEIQKKKIGLVEKTLMNLGLTEDPDKKKMEMIKDYVKKVKK